MYRPISLRISCIAVSMRQPSLPLSTTSRNSKLSENTTYDRKDVVGDVPRVLRCHGGVVVVVS